MPNRQPTSASNDAASKSFMHYLQQEAELARTKLKLSQLENKSDASFVQFKDLTYPQISSYLKQLGDGPDAEIGKYLFLMKWLRADKPNRSTHISSLYKLINYSAVFEADRAVLDAEFEDDGLLADNIDCLKIYTKLLKAQQSTSTRTAQPKAVEAVSNELSDSNDASSDDLPLNQRLTPQSQENGSSLIKTTPKSNGSLSARNSPAPPGSATELLEVDSESSASDASSDCVPIKKARNLRQRKSKRLSKTKTGSETRKTQNSQNAGKSAPGTPAVQAPKRGRLATRACRSTPGMIRNPLSRTTLQRQKSTQLKMYGAAAQSSNSENSDSDVLAELIDVDGTEDISTSNGPCLFYANQEPRGRFLYRFDWQTKESTQLYKFEGPREYSTMVIHGNDIYDLGGTPLKHKPFFGDSHGGSKTVEIFGIGNDRRRAQGPEMLETRKEFSACAFDNSICVIGGCFKFSALNCCEMLDVSDLNSSSTWKKMEYLNAPRGAHASVVLGKAIYTVGGIGSTHLNSVEVYNAEDVAPKWRFVAPLCAARGRHGLVEFNGKLYALGGEGVAQRPINTVEVYDPIADKWEALAPMSHARLDFNVCVMDDRIWVISGVETQSWNQVMEAYDPREGTWESFAWETHLHTTGKFYSAVSRGN